MSLPRRFFSLGQISRHGLIWNAASFALIAVSGLLINVLVANLYPPSVLGAFNRVLAFYIVAAQIATFALHYSVLYHISVLSEASTQAGAIARSGLLTGVLISAAVCAALWFGRGLLANSEAVKAGLEVAIPGLFLFPLNKILLAMLNGTRRLRAYALANGGRYFLIVAAIGANALMGLPEERVPLCLTVAEVVLFLGLVASNWGLLARRISAADTDLWMRKHLRFGSRGVAGGLLVELNTRVDILVLGIFVSDTEVGVYSIGAIFAEGLLQLLLVLRINIDPILGRLIAESRQQELDALIASGKKIGYAAMAAAGILGIVLYPFVLDILIGKPELAGSWTIFTILTVGIILSAGFVPFGGILQQGGHPIAQSMLAAIIAGINLIGNLILIPYYGAVGAAAATALSQALYPIVLIVLARRWLGIRL